MCVLILGTADDDHARFMLDHLRARGIDVELLDSRWFPSAATITFDPRTGRGGIRLPHGRALRLDEVRSVYWRNYAGVEPQPLEDPEQAYIAANDARGLFESLLECRHVRWVNGRRAFELHQVKPAALAIVAQLGVPVPQTLLTNDPAAVREFVVRVPGAIFKPVQGGAHTRRVEPRHLTDENLAHLAYAPVTLQEEIPGTNLRVFVAGERVLCIEVRSGAIDFRDDERPELIACEMPHELETWSRRIAERLELVWTGIDWRRTPAGDHYFLEANPSPMFLGFEKATGLPLTESLVRLLDVTAD
jgi:glutathione synthase/RimK-type ligase-like ATP-grasp enzyme